MKLRTAFCHVLFFCSLVLCGFNSSLHAQTSTTVTNDNSFHYFFTTVPGTNPTLTLNRGVTYQFNLILGSIHPFFIKTNVSAGSLGAYTNGITGNGQVTGVLTFVVPTNAPDQLFYNCANHSTSFGMHGTLNISNAPVPAPPSGQIVLISFSETGVTMQSIGATNWHAFPEFSSNLEQNAWATVPNFTNVLANGTNTTTFDRLDPICGPNVFLRVRNTFP